MSQVKFKTLAKEWLEFKEPQIKESTYLNYKYAINRRLLDEFGNITLTQMKKYNFNSYVKNRMYEWSSKTVKDNLIILKQVLKYAERKYNMDYKLDLIATPSFTRKEIKIFNDRERRKILEYCINSNDKRALGELLSLVTGMRIGEVCALQWKDIDFKDNVINITRTLERIYTVNGESKIIISSPKTKNSIRQIPIPKILIPKLKEESRNISKEKYIMQFNNREFVEPSTLRYFHKSMLRKLKIPYKKYHCLRHTFATCCVKYGVDIKSLSEILGHANVGITLEIYVHSSLSTKRKYLDKMYA